MMNNEIEEKEYTLNLIILIHNLWKGIKKFWWLVIVLTALTTGFSCYKVYQEYVPFYTAAATFTVNLDTDNKGSIYYDNQIAYQMSGSFPYIITSEVLRNLIAADLGMENAGGFVTAENVEGTNLFTIKATSDRPQKAYDYLQSVIRNYPTVAEKVLGNTRLNMLDETGIPKGPSNSLNYRDGIWKGMIPGGLLGLIIIAVYAFTRRTIQGTDDMSGLTNMKHLGTVPKALLKRKGKDTEDAVSYFDECINPMFRESIYIMRTRVEKIAQNRGLKSILITSAVAGEGKSTISFNLAQAMAEGGKKVALVDCDLRNPSIKNILGMQEVTAGISEVLRGEKELEEALGCYGEYNIPVLANLQPSKDASELISSIKMNEIIKKLEEAVDYVIIDTPPSAVLPDTFDLAKYVDGVIYVVKQDFAKVSQILEGLNNLTESSSANMIGYVLNAARAGTAGHYYGAYGKYGKYGYGMKQKKEELQAEEG